MSDILQDDQFVSFLDTLGDPFDFSCLEPEVGIDFDCDWLDPALGLPNEQ
jgi:hypothetical protein